MFQITLRAARISCGYTLEEVAEYCKVSVEMMNDTEKDSSNIAYDSKAIKLYGISSDLIYFGLESDCIKHNRESVT